MKKYIKNMISRLLYVFLALNVASGVSLYGMLVNRAARVRAFAGSVKNKQMPRNWQMARNLNTTPEMAQYQQFMPEAKAAAAIVPAKQTIPVNDDVPSISIKKTSHPWLAYLLGLFGFGWGMSNTITPKEEEYATQQEQEILDIIKDWNPGALERLCISGKNAQKIRNYFKENNTASIERIFTEIMQNNNLLFLVTLILIDDKAAAKKITPLIKKNFWDYFESMNWSKVCIIKSLLEKNPEASNELILVVKHYFKPLSETQLGIYLLESFDLWWEGADIIVTKFHTPYDIENEFKRIKEDKYKEHQEILHNILHQFNIPAEKFPEIMKKIEDTKKFNLNAMQYAHPDVMHDQSIPESMLTMTKKILWDANINPQSINIINGNEGRRVTFWRRFVRHFNRLFSRPTRTPTAYVNTYSPENNNYVPATLALFPNNLDKAGILATLAHERQHIIEQHVIERMMVIEYIKAYNPGILWDDKALKAYKAIASCYEEEADIFPTLLNSKVAYARRQEIRTGVHLEISDHKKHEISLIKINTLWRLHKAMTKQSEEA